MPVAIIVFEVLVIVAIVAAVVFVIIKTRK